MEKLREEHGLDQPIPVRYLKWIVHVAQGDFGYSYFSRKPVAHEIAVRLPNTIQLVGLSLVLALAVSIPLGIVSGTHPQSYLDHIISSVVFLGQAMPSYVLGIILIYIFHILLKNPVSGKPLLPIGSISSWGQNTTLQDRVEHLILPIITLSYGSLARYSRFVRGSVIEVLEKDYIITARSKGLKPITILTQHVLRNAMIPLVTVVALDLPYLISGAFFVEVVFSWPGIARLSYQAVTKRDYPVLISLTMLVAIFVILANLIADIIYSLIDPRLTYEKRL